MDGSNDRAGDEVVQLSLLRLTALNIVLLNELFAFAGHFINHIVDSFGSSFLTPFKAALVAALMALFPSDLAAEEVNMRPTRPVIVSNRPLPPYAYFRA